MEELIIYLVIKGTLKIVEAEDMAIWKLLTINVKFSALALGDVAPNYIDISFVCIRLGLKMGALPLACQDVSYNWLPSSYRVSWT